MVNVNQNDIPKWGILALMRNINTYEICRDWTFKIFDKVDAEDRAGMTKWKATEILKAVKEEREVKAGGYGVERNFRVIFC